MLTTLIFLGSFVSLSFWFLFKNQNELRPMFGKAFLLSFAAYLGMVFLMPGTAVSWLNFGLNLVFLFGAGFFLNTFSSSKIIFVPMLILFTLGYYYSVRGIDWFPFANTSGQTTENLATDSELLLELKEGESTAGLQEVLNTYNLKIVPAFQPADGTVTDLDDYYTVDIPEEQLAAYDQIVADLMKTGLVDYTEPNEVLSLDPVEQIAATAPSKRSRYTANDPDLGKVWAHAVLEVEALYEFLAIEKITVAKKAKIAIIDTGVDGKHEDLADNFVSTASKHNTDPHGHGTHCAGIAAAVSNNAKGIASFAPNSDLVEVTSVKVFGPYGSTSQKIIIDGMLEAVDNGATVLSMSLGGPSSPSRQRAYQKAVEYANKKGAIVVVAAGNEDMDARKRAPASVKGVITVSAIDEALDKASFSNRVGGLKMGIAAPGVQIYSTTPDNSYQFFNGTSMATPYVAGLVGILKALDPTLDTQTAYNILSETGKSTSDVANTGKLINPIGAVKKLLKK